VINQGNRKEEREQEEEFYFYEDSSQREVDNSNTSNQSTARDQFAEENQTERPPQNDDNISPDKEPSRSYEYLD
jgi:hypothetical protein